MNVDREVALLVDELNRFGGRVKFGTLCTDERCANIFEALGGTLKAAKKRKVISYDSELLLQGAHDDVEIVLLQPNAGLSSNDSSPKPQDPQPSAQQQPVNPESVKPETQSADSSEQPPSKQPEAAAPSGAEADKTALQEPGMESEGANADAATDAAAAQ